MCRTHPRIFAFAAVLLWVFGVAAAETAPSVLGAEARASVSTARVSGAPEEALHPSAPAALEFRQSSFLPPLSDAVINGVRAENQASGERRLQIGMGRSLPEPVVIEGRGAAGGNWSRLKDSSRAYAVLITSAGAKALRLHLQSVSLPTNAVLYVFDPERPAVNMAPITSETLAGATDVWTDTLFTDRLAVQIQVPAGTSTEGANLKIGEVSHLFSSPMPEAGAAQCYPDVACYPAYAQPASGVARIAFVQGGNTYVCTGCLLAGGSDTAHYFLTARHCIGSQGLASTIEFFWFYEAPNCRGTPPSIDTVTKTTGGADLLASGGPSDFTFLRLRHAPPDNASPLAWSTSPPSSTETLACIHHPGGRQKAINLGRFIGNDANFWGVRWSAGATEDGSSGAPLLNAYGQVIGQMNSGFNGPGSSCANPTAPDQFGRFDVSYASLQRWLPGNTPPPPQPTFTKGTYYGLFYDRQGAITPTTAGSITAAVTVKGLLTGKLQLGRYSYSFRGMLDQNGAAQISVRRRNLSPLVLNIQISPDNPDSLTGSVGDDSFTSEISADRMVYGSRSSQAPQAGRYTIVIPGSNDPNQPEGNSYGTVVISRAGSVRFAGTMADGTTVSRSAVVSKDGQWPLAVPMYSGQGLLLGWMNFSDPTSSSLGGTVTWLKPVVARAKLYPNGFGVQSTANASAYTPPARGSSVLNMSQGNIMLQGGGLDSSIFNSFNMGPAGRVMNAGPSKMTMSFSTGAGTFRGAIVDPNNPKKRIPFGGVVLQDQNSGAGFFTGQGRTGKVVVSGQ